MYDQPTKEIFEQIERVARNQESFVQYVDATPDFPKRKWSLSLFSKGSII